MGQTPIPPPPPPSPPGLTRGSMHTAADPVFMDGRIKSDHDGGLAERPETALVLRGRSAAPQDEDDWDARPHPPSSC